MEQSDENELRNDFRNLLRKIDFGKYDPCSREFIAALNIGVMLFLARELGEISGVDVHSEKTDDGISGKIQSAKRNLQLYIDSRNSSYKEKALDEIKEIESLVKKAFARLPGADEKSKLRDYEIKASELRAQAESL